MKRVLSLLLSLLLGLCGCGPLDTIARSYLRYDRPVQGSHGHTPFSDMILAYPDPDEVEAILDEALQNVTAADNEKGFIDIYDAQTRAYNDLVSATSLAYVRYCQDITDDQRKAEYTKLNSSLYAIQYRLARLEKVLMDRWGYHRERGGDYADALDRMTRQSEERAALRAREDELCRQYERLETEYRLTYGGRSWSMAELMGDEDLSLPSFLDALEQFEAGKNQAAGTLFAELMALRKQMAQEGGFPSYAASQYDTFGREYTPQQALAAAKIVKQVFVPLYIRLRKRCENDLRYLSGATFDEDQFIAAMEQSVEHILPGAGEAWRYMLSYGLYDSRPSERKMGGSFTTYFSAYRCPFLFTQWKDDASSVFTVIHEFGHFLSYYLNPEGTYYGSENLDLAETDAQGFELLMLQEYDALFGRYAHAARLCFLTNALYAILSGFMEDEFQQRAYLLRDPTGNDLNELYAEVAASYGFDQLFGYEGREWTEIGHTFQFPFYYVSYGVSMLGAMTLMENGGKGYAQLVRRRAGTSFMDAVGTNVLEEESIRQAAAWAEKTVDAWLDE